MAQTYEIDINRYNGTDYDTLLPTPATHASSHKAKGTDPIEVSTGSLASDFVLPVTKGGTNATSVLAARANLEAQKQITTASIALAAASWTGDDPYTQMVTISGVTAKSRVDLNPSAAVLAAAMEGGYGLVIGNNNGTVTAYTVGAKPTADISVQVSITEVD